MSDDDIINLDERRPARGRPPKSEATKADFRRPQTVSFISSALGVDRRTVERKLVGLAPVAREGKSDLYDFADACKAMFKSETGLSAQALANLDPTQLPPTTQAAFWAAQKARMAVYKEAGEFFHADDILLSHASKDKVFRREILALPGKIQAAERNGQSYEDMAHEILKTVADASKKALKELTGKSYAADLRDVEQRLESGEDDDAGPN